MKTDSLKKLPLTKSLEDVRVEQWRTHEDGEDERLLDPAKMRRKVEANAIVASGRRRILRCRKQSELSFFFFLGLIKGF